VRGEGHSSVRVQELAEEELVELHAQLAAHVRAFMTILCPVHASDSIESILVEIDGGAGECRALCVEVGGVPRWHGGVDVCRRIAHHV